MFYFFNLLIVMLHDINPWGVYCFPNRKFLSFLRYDTISTDLRQAKDKAPAPDAHGWN